MNKARKTVGKIIITVFIIAVFLVLLDRDRTPVVVGLTFGIAVSFLLLELMPYLLAKVIAHFRRKRFS